MSIEVRKTTPNVESSARTMVTGGASVRLVYRARLDRPFPGLSRIVWIGDGGSLANRQRDRKPRPAKPINKVWIGEQIGRLNGGAPTGPPKEHPTGGVSVVAESMRPHRGESG